MFEIQNSHPSGVNEGDKVTLKCTSATKYIFSTLSKIFFLIFVIFFLIALISVLGTMRGKVAISNTMTI